MTRGRFISIEGLEGAGKSTCMRHLVSRIEVSGHSVVTTREPGGTVLGEQIRELLIGPVHENMDARAETLLVFAARAQHLAEVIEPALMAGRWVVCDRFTDATYAYQGGGRELGSGRVAVLEDWVQGPLRPDLTLFLDVEPAQGLARAARRSEPDRFEREQREFFERTRAAYLRRLEDDPRRVRRIDAGSEPAAVRRAIDDILDAVFARWQ